jgi:hypothetical protein
MASPDSFDGATRSASSFLSSSRGTLSSSVSVSALYFAGFWINCRRRWPERSLPASCSSDATVQASSNHWKRLPENEGLPALPVRKPERIFSSRATRRSRSWPY